jgi:intracellular multiplication protein IcmL
MRWPDSVRAAPKQHRTMQNQSDAIRRKLEEPDFQWKLFRGGVAIILAQSMCIAILVAAGIWQHYHPHADHFFYADGVHTPYPIESLEDPVENEPKLLADVGQWVVETFSIDFLNYQRDLSRASRHYTVQGWNSFAAEFIESGNFAEIKRAKLSSTAVPERAPIILQKSLIGSHYTYKIQVPLLVTFQNTQQQNAQHLMATVLVVRTPASQHVEGYAIDQLNAPPA